MLLYTLNKTWCQYKKDYIDFEKCFFKNIYQKPTVFIYTFLKKYEKKKTLIEFSYLYNLIFNKSFFFNEKNTYFYLYTSLKYKYLYFFLINFINNNNKFLYNKSNTSNFYFISWFPFFLKNHLLRKLLKKKKFKIQKFFLKCNIALTYFYKMA